jgi:hypothetical protein
MEAAFRGLASAQLGQVGGKPRSLMSVGYK